MFSPFMQSYWTKSASVFCALVLLHYTKKEIQLPVRRSLCSEEKMFLVSFQMELLFVGGVSEQNVSLTFDQPKENCYKIFNLRYTENICSSI